MNEILEKIEEGRIMPVAVIEDAGQTEALGGAMRKGGINMVEITFRTAAAAEAISRMSKAYPDMLVGAGTVINAAQAEQAYLAGAKFIISPGFSQSVAGFCKSKSILYIPGCVTPAEIMTAIDNGITVVKFFPAGVFGGLKAIKALAAPFAGVKFMPTGGVSADNLAEYLAFGRITACGGSWMTDSRLLQKGDYAEIEKLCREARVIADSVKR